MQRQKLEAQIELLEKKLVHIPKTVVTVNDVKHNPAWFSLSNKIKNLKQKLERIKYNEFLAQ